MPTRGAEASFLSGNARARDLLYDQPHWYACQTRARHEKVVEALLSRQNVEAYLPLKVRESQWKDRRKKVAFPLFPGYVFARFTLHDVIRVVSTHGVGRVVGAAGQPTPIPEGEIESVRLLSAAAAATGQAVDPVDLVCQGAWVRVADGPFKDVQGIVVERRGRRRVLVGIAAIGQGLEADIDVACLLPIPAP